MSWDMLLTSFPGLDVLLFRLQVKLPFFVGAAGADAALSEGGQLLQLTLPYRPFTEVLEQVMWHLQEYSSVSAAGLFHVPT